MFCASRQRSTTSSSRPRRPDAEALQDDVDPQIIFGIGLCVVVLLTFVRLAPVTAEFAGERHPRRPPRHLRRGCDDPGRRRPEPQRPLPALKSISRPEDPSRSSCQPCIMHGIVPAQPKIKIPRANRSPSTTATASIPPQRHRRTRAAHTPGCRLRAALGAAAALPPGPPPRRSARPPGRSSRASVPAAGDVEARGARPRAGRRRRRRRWPARRRPPPRRRGPA